MGTCLLNIRYVDYRGLAPPGGMCNKNGGDLSTSVSLKDTFLYLVNLILNTFMEKRVCNLRACVCVCVGGPFSIYSNRILHSE